jgi:site-specific recombinase XerD
MRKKTSITIIGQAIHAVPEFKKVVSKPGQQVTLHSLRNSYATHLLGDGVNIATLKELLGHAEVTTTMVYLHIAQCETIKAHSPLDTLYNRDAKRN